MPRSLRLKWGAPVLALLLTPVQAGAQTALFTSNSLAKAQVATGDAASGKAATVTPDLFTGSFSYSVPIEVPRARGDMQPELIMRYRSYSGNGWLGMGWTLDAGGIERSSRTGVRYDQEDFVLKDADGPSDLMKMPSGEYRAIIESEFLRVKKLVASDGQPYFEVTRRNGRKYTYGSTAGSRQFDPRPGQAQRVFRWCLDRIEDPSGNFVTFSYARDPDTLNPASQGAIYLDRVDYGGAPGLAPNAYVKFYRESRTDSSLSYATGFPVRMSYRLRTIEVRAGDSLVRAYRLGYLPNGALTGRSVLGTIQELGSDALVSSDGTVTDGSSFPASSFTYTAGGTVPNASVPGPVRYISGSLAEAEHDIGRAQLGDFDGDGRTDVAFISGWNGYFAMDIYYGGVSGLATTPEPGPVIFVAGDHDGLITGEYRVKMGDFNGDGRTDIAILEGWCAASPGVPMTIYYAKATGRGFEAGVSGPPRQTACDHEGARIDASRVLVGDFNGDGRSDFLTIEGWDSAGNGGHAFPMKLYLSNPNATGGFDPPRDTGPALWIPGDYAGLWDVIARMKLGDFNGDGKTDVAVVEGWQTWASGGTPMSIYYANDAGTGFVRGDGPVRGVGGDHDAVRIDAGRVIPGDFNGDGKTDFITADGWNSGSTPTAMNLYLSNGSGFDPPQAVGPLLFYPGDYAGMYDVIARFKLGDFNGDGKTDIAIVEGWSGDSEMSIYLATDWGFLPRIAGPVRLMGGSHEMVRLDAARVLVGDVNGDGKADLSAIEGWQGPLGVFGRPVPAGSYPMSVYLSPVSPPDLLASVSNGRGASTTLQYLSSTAYPNTLLPLVVQTLSSMSTSVTTFDGTSTTSTTSFAYAGGYFHLAEREFRGFSYAMVSDPWGRNGERLERETWFHQGNGTTPGADDPSQPTGYMKGRPWRSKVADSAVRPNNVETLTTYWPDAVGAGPWADADGAAPWFTPIQRVDTTKYEAGVAVVQSQTEYKEYDNYGNVTREIQHGDLATLDDDRTVVRTFDANTDAWIVSLPATENVYHDTTQLSGKWFYYDGIPVVPPNASELDRRALCGDAPANVSVATRPTTGNLTRVVEWAHYCAPDGTCADGPNPEARSGYDELGNVVCTRNPRGAVTTVQYDATATYPRLANNALGQQSETTYYGIDTTPLDLGSYGQVESVTDPNGAITAQVRYDKLGRKVREIVPGATTEAGDGLDWAVTTWDYAAYAADGREYVRTELHSKPGAISAIGALDATSRVTWSESYLDGFGREVKVRRPGADGNVALSVRKFDARGALTSESVPFFEIGDVERDTALSYDAFGRVTSATSPAGTVATCHNGGVTVRIDENLHRRRETRDANGRLVKVEEYLGTYPLPCTTSALSPYAATQYTYDPLGRLTFVTDAKGNKTEIRYDSLGLKRYLHDPDTGVTEYRYDAAGSLVWQQDPVLKDFAALPKLENAITFEYDPLERVTRKAYPDGTDVIYDYDADYDPPDSTLPPSAPIGRLTRMTDSSGTETYRYDTSGRVTRSTKTVQPVGTYAIQTAYDALQRTRKLVYPTGDTVAYAYDAADNLLSAGSYVTYSGYNALGQPRFAVYGNGVKTELSYFDDTNRRAKTLTIDSPLDANGPGTGVRRYASLTYGYDGIGNVVSILDGKDSNRSQTLHYDDLDRLDGAQSGMYGSQSFSYDMIGNITQKDGVTYKYSTIPHSLAGTTGDRPHAVLSTSGDVSPGRLRKIDYDLENRPTSITRGGSVTSFVYDGAGSRVKKVTAQAVTAYIKGLVECTGATCGIYIMARGTRIALKTGSDVKYYHQNHVGSTILVTSSTGTALEEIAYRPYGTTTLDTGVVNMNHKFTGQERDPETELYYYGARYYDPALGRFISPDPLVPDAFDPQMLNRYAYARNNPINYIDPSGNVPLLVIAAVVVPSTPALLTIGGVAAFTWGATYLASPKEERKRMIRDLKEFPRRTEEEIDRKWDEHTRWWDDRADATRAKFDRAAAWAREQTNGSAPCSFVCSGGFSVGGQAEAGALLAGGGAQGSLGAGYFRGTNRVSGFASGGAFLGGPGYGIGAPRPLNDGSALNVVSGASIGGSGGVWLSNASAAPQFAGRGHTTTVQIGIGATGVAIQFTKSGPDVWMLSAELSPPMLNWGVSWSSYPTYTVTTK